MNDSQDPRTTALRLFAVLFASQAGVLTLSPILREMSADLGVAPEIAGQLRAVSGLIAGVVALWLASRRAPRLGLRRLLRVSLALLGGSALLISVAPSFAVVAIAQIPLGVGVAGAMSAATAAAGEWSTPESRNRVLSWTLLGQPAAWIVGMPVVGLAAAVDWRLSWIALPFLSAIVALAALRGHPATEQAASPPPRDGLRSMLRHGAARRWALGEVLAFAGWSGTLVYAGSVFVDSYGLTPAVTSVILAAVAAAYTVGNLLFRQWAAAASPATLLLLAQACVAPVVAFGVFRPSAAVSALLLGVVAFVAGARTLAGSAAGLRTTDDKLAAMAVRTSAVQFGYLAGATVGGLALAIGGYGAMGWAFGVLFCTAGIPHLSATVRRRLPAAVPGTPVPAPR
jgi:MFS transporter, DHA1 family, inner membrane transport protein